MLEELLSRDVGVMTVPAVNQEHAAGATLPVVDIIGCVKMYHRVLSIACVLL